MYGRPAMHLYITQSLYFAMYTKPLEGIQLMSIAGYEAFVCVCFVYKTLCAAFILLLWDARSRLLRICVSYLLVNPPGNPEIFPGFDHSYRDPGDTLQTPRNFHAAVRANFFTTNSAVCRYSSMLYIRSAVI